MADEAEVNDKESLARAHLPYKAEYCKTSRAKCKKCGEAMEANSLKLANMTKSRFHDGYDATFYHVNCFFQIKRPSSVAEIRHFETLKYQDQKMIEEAVESKGLSVLGSKVEIKETSKGEKSNKKSDKKAKKRSEKESNKSDGDFLVNYDDFLVEYAKSSRAKCIKCEEKIEKETIRLGKLDYNADTPYQFGPVPRWYHLDCFIKNMEQLEFFGLIEKVKGFDELEDDDKKMLKKKVKPIKPSEDFVGGKKMKSEDDTKVDPAAKEEKEKLEKALEKQSDRFFKLREFVDTMKRKDLEDMLEYMKQKSHFRSPSLLVNMATDVLLFGPLKRCPVCKQRGGIELRGTSYICSKSINDSDEPCTYETREPKRGVPDVPEDIIEKYPYFNDKYRFVGGPRIFPPNLVKAVEQKEAENNNIVQEGAPLDGISVGVISWKAIPIEKSKVQKKVITLGGKLLTALDRSLFVILTSDDELDKDSPKIEVAKALEVPFAKADFLFKIESKDDVVKQVQKCLIGGWSGDLEARFKAMQNKTEPKPEVKHEIAE